MSIRNDDASELAWLERERRNAEESEKMRTDFASEGRHDIHDEQGSIQAMRCEYGECPGVIALSADPAVCPSCGMVQGVGLPAPVELRTLAEMGDTAWRIAQGTLPEGIALLMVLVVPDPGTAHGFKGSFRYVTPARMDVTMVVGALERAAMEAHLAYRDGLSQGAVAVEGR